MKVALLAALALVVLIAFPAHAARKHHGADVAGNSVTLVGDPVFGNVVTFAVTSTVAQPYVLLTCSQNGVLVDAENHGFWDGAPFGTLFTLGPTSVWTGGDADCSAILVDYAEYQGASGTTTPLASLDFHVTG